MSLLFTTNDTLKSIVSLIEDLPAQEQVELLKALETKKLFEEAARLDKGVNKKKIISMLEIVNEVKKHRKESGYKAYSI